MNHTKKYPIRFIFITDIKSVFQVEKIFEDILPPFELSNFINSENIPRFHRDYINVELIIDMVNPWINIMKKYFNNPKGRYRLNTNSSYYYMDFTDKYDSTIYYISPYYQRIFPKLNKLIVMDTDMEFRVDPVNLFNEFDKFSINNILACGNDLAPHYYTMLDAAG